jgi:hypothetical protein
LQVRRYGFRERTVGDVSCWWWVFFVVR